jgi:hypothetical protein
VLYLLGACPTASFLTLASNDDVDSGVLCSLLTYAGLLPGVEYFLMVEGYGTEEGAFGLSYTLYPSDAAPSPANATAGVLASWTAEQGDAYGVDAATGASSSAAAADISGVLFGALLQTMAAVGSAAAARQV